MSIGIIGNDDINRLINIYEENKYYDNSVNITLNTPNESHVLLCNRIKPNSLVLDIGCATGIIGKILKNELDCEIYGIELDKKAIEYAKQTKAYNDIFNFDIVKRNCKEFERFEKNNLKFDYIVFADVLEHLVDPADVIVFFIQYLKKDGKILTSLPNISHYDIINGLLNDNFNYSSMGILDNTHIRFFTKYSFAQYIDSINKKFNKNIDLKWFGKTVIKPHFYEKYPNLNRIMKNNEDFLVLQNMFELTPNSNTTNNLDSLLNENRVNVTNIIEERLSLTEGSEKYDKLLEKYKAIKRENIRLNSELNHIYNNEKRYMKAKSKLPKPIVYINKFNKDVYHSIKFKNDNKQSILFFVHAWKNIDNQSSTFIGGTTLYVLDLINKIKNQKHCYVVTVINDRYMLVVLRNNCEYIYDLGISVKIKNFDGYDYDFYRTINSLILNLQIDLIHVNHIIDFPCDLALIAKNIPTIYTIHDYSFMCPRYFLLNSKNQICVGQSIEKCGKCIDDFKATEYKIRKEACLNLLVNSNKVIIPDESLHDKLKNIYDCKNLEVIPHGLDIEKFNKFDLYNGSLKKENVNVAFVGNVDGHKGGKIVEDVINNMPQITFHLFGVSERTYFLKNHDNYIYHGPYNNCQISKMLNENKIDLVMFLNQCEESFSYTLSEVLYAKVPCLAFDIGAIGNRIKKDNLGWVIPVTNNWKEIAKNYETIKTEYDEIYKNVNNYKVKTLKEYAQEIDCLYDEYRNENKKYLYNQFKFLENYNLFIKIK